MLLSDESIAEAVRACRRAGVSFAVIREKEHDEVRLFADDGRSGAPLSDAFFFARQWNESGPAVTLADRLTLAEVCAMPEAPAAHPAPADPSTQEADYLRDVTALTKTLVGEGPRAKTVISRIITEDARIDAADAAERLFRERRDATCCVFSDAEGALWLVATPELLLHVDEASSRVTTMSLAGTKAADDLSSWDVKNIEEHNIVTSYIIDRMGMMADDVTASADTPSVSGAVRHLCTMITARLRPGVTPADAAAYLSPTPAVCGMTPDAAKMHIATIERHRRRFYSGYLGVATPGKAFSAYVTLRCARLVPGSFSIYVGGGITARSVARDEWLETCAKARPLLNILNQQHISNHER